MIIIIAKGASGARPWYFEEVRIKSTVKELFGPREVVSGYRCHGLYLCPPLLFFTLKFSTCMS